VKIGFKRWPMLRQFALGMIMLTALQLLDPAGDVRAELARETGLRNPPQSQDVSIRHALAAQVEPFHTPLDAWLGMMKPPIPSGCAVRFAKGDLDHGRAPAARDLIKLMRPPLAQGSQKVSTNPVWSITLNISISRVSLRRPVISTSLNRFFSAVSCSKSPSSARTQMRGGQAK
jgi:hypothetical protein